MFYLKTAEFLMKSSLPHADVTGFKYDVRHLESQSLAQR